MLDHLTCWRIALWIQDGVLPDVSLSDIRWESSGRHSLDRSTQRNQRRYRCHWSLSLVTHPPRQQGLDFYDVADELAAENNLSKA